MKRFWVAAILVALSGAGSAAAEDLKCAKGASDFLTPINWRVASEDAGVHFWVAIKSPADKQIVLSDAVIYFQDGLGRYVGGDGIRLPEGMTIDAHSSTGVEFGVGPPFDAAIANMPSTQVFICTRAVLFADGTKETFGK